MKVFTDDIKKIQEGLERIAKEHDQTTVHVLVDPSDPKIKSITRSLSKFSFIYPEVYVNNGTSLLMLTKRNTIFNEPKENPILYAKIQSLLSNYKKPTCSYTFRLSSILIKHLDKMVHYIKYKEKQKEFTGHLSVFKIEYKNDTPVFVLDMNEGQVYVGEDEEVDGANKPITFHTHPKEAYDKYSMKFAWPSQSDYITIYELIVRLNGVCHVLAALEGIYIIYLKPSFLEKIDELKEKGEEDVKKLAIKTSYPKEERPNLNITPRQYKMNLDNDKTNPFQIEFLEWEKATTPFTINIQRVGDTIQYCKRF